MRPVPNIPTDPIEFILTMEELDMAFAETLKGCMIDGEEVPVHYFMPDMDIEEKKAPLIIFYRNGTYADMSRYQNDKVKDNAVYEDGKLLAYDVREAPHPVNVTYQVKTVYEQQIHGSFFQAFFARNFPRDFYITVKGINYRVDSMDQVGGRYSSRVGGAYDGAQYKDFGRMEEGEREFGDIFNYRVEVYQDIHERKQVKVALEVTVTTELKEENEDVQTS